MGADRDNAASLPAPIEPPATPAEAAARALQLIARNLIIAQGLQGRIAKGVASMDPSKAARALSTVTSSSAQLLQLYRLLAPTGGEELEADRPATSAGATAAARKLLEAVRSEQLARERAAARKVATTLPAPLATKQ